MWWFLNAGPRLYNAELVRPLTAALTQAGPAALGRLLGLTLASQPKTTRPRPGLPGAVASPGKACNGVRRLES